MGKDKRNGVIEINGHRYDAVTGQLLNPTQAALLRTAKPDTAHKHPVASHPAPKHATSQAKVMDIAAPSRAIHHTTAHRPERGTTLMRHAVKQPAPALKRHVKAVTPTDILVARAPKLHVAPKWSYLQVDPKRLARADHVVKSKLVRRFAPFDSFAYTSTGPAIAMPVPTPPVVTGNPDRPMPSPTHHQPGSHKSMDVFQRALKHANAHEQLPVKPTKKHLRHIAKHRSKTHKFRHRTATLATSALAIVLLAGFIAYQNKANLELRVASAATGVHASLPGFKPSGFALGKLTYSPGSVAVAFHNDTTGASYKIIQQNSSWDSATLLDSFVAAKNNTYQTMQTGGRTVYLYGNNNASWVSGGIWYQITDNGSLTTNDVLNIASSM